MYHAFGFSVETCMKDKAIGGGESMHEGGVADVNSKTQVELYRQMLRIRMLEEKIAELYPEQEMRCPVHLSIGQEAPPVGVCAHLLREDLALSAHRSHGHYLAKGGDIKAMVAELYGKETGCSAGIGGSMHLVDLEAGFLGAVPIMGSTIPIAVGAAWGSALKQKSQVVVSFFGEAAVEEGVFHEAANFAVLRKLPVVFVCENNMYSVYSPLAVRRPDQATVSDVAKGHGIWTRQSDGNDVLGIFSLAGEAINRARAGLGPSFLELMTYRWLEHCGPNDDNDLGYRTRDEFEAWQKRCPIQQMENNLRKVDLLTENALVQLKEDLSREIEDAVDFAKRSPFPDVKNMMANVYAS
jgi:TPP-dependent pyruvate/acetoin dehydrogenase alpha subunit